VGTPAPLRELSPPHACSAAASVISETKRTATIQQQSATTVPDVPAAAECRNSSYVGAIPAG
jgi:hypothetical protein